MFFLVGERDVCPCPEKEGKKNVFSDPPFSFLPPPDTPFSFLRTTPSTGHTHKKTCSSIHPTLEAK